MTNPAAPADDEVEISAFGPGYGETILIHLGLGEWMIVDSCVKSGRLPALDHLRAMGVDPATAVKLVVATHWHDDHVRGIARVLAQCPDATFVCSVALNRDELWAAIGQERPYRFGKVTSGVDEMRGVVAQLERAGERHRLAWALQRGELFRRHDPMPCRVMALSPCNSVVTEAYRGIAELIEAAVAADPPSRIPKPLRNDGAVVLWIEVGDATMLLGADLEETAEPTTGWTAVVACHPDPERQSEIFKVPHHGSDNGHQPLVWTTLLVDQPEAVVCPFERGDVRLPTDDDLDRLCQLATVHLTADPRRPTSTVRRGRQGRVLTLDFGRVTLRRPTRGEATWEPSYEAPALDICRSRAPSGTGGAATR